MNAMLIYHPDCVLHAMPRHPESPERLTAVLAGLKDSGVMADMIPRKAEPATTEALSAVHSYVSDLIALEPREGLAEVDADTFMNKGSVRAAQLAAGACIDGTRAILAGETDRVFCAVRPPGHHAELRAAMGFCLFNNIALGVRTALDAPGIERVAVLDFDVHHCNGTVDIFKDDERVLVCSSFQDNFYPHRYLHFENDHIVGSPLPAGTGSTAFRTAVERDWTKAVERFQPQMIFVSAGFDAHADDPLGGLMLTDDDYRWVTRLVCDLAADHADGRILSTLEGGYNLAALARSANVHVEVLTSGR